MIGHTEMVIDWNWFFSAFAQCASALIGIIAAFTISKLLSESDKMEDYKNAITEMFLKKNDLMRKIGARKFDWHDRVQIEHSYKLKEAIENGEFKNCSEEEQLETLFSTIPGLYGSENCLDYLSKQLDLSNQPRFIPPVNGLWEGINKERESIKSLELESIGSIGWFANKKIEIGSKSKNTKTLEYTIYILMFGFLTTVIYPLHFLPIEANKIPSLNFSYSNFLFHLLSTKGLLLALLSATICGLFIYFLILIKNIQNQYNDLDVSIKPESLRLPTYSKYFKNIL